MTTTQITRVAEFVGMSPDELRAALRTAATCPLCIEVGDAGHTARGCLNVLDVMSDQCADARNSAF